MFFFYRFIIAPLLRIIFNVGAFFSRSFFLRKETISQFQKKSKEFSSSKKVLWVHASSMGEFEQAKPVIEYLRKVDNSLYQIIVTFFSPSGYENQKEYAYVDFVTYLPIDTFGTMSEFVSTICPSVVVFVRYDIWPNLLTILFKKGIPFYFINATYPRSMLWELIGKKFLKDLLQPAMGIYCVNQRETTLFESLLGTSNVYLSADTRIDRIIEKVLKQEPFLFYKIPNKPVIVLGSSWEIEENLLKDIPQKILKRFHCIIVPHKPTELTVARLQQIFPESLRLSNLQSEETPRTDIVIVDSIDKLLSIYSIASIAFIGGGFRRCVHSTTEALAFGIPVFCGPKYRNSPDTTNYVKNGFVTIVENSKDIEAVLTKVLTDKHWVEHIQTTSKELLHKSLGTSQIISEIIRKHLL